MGDRHGLCIAFGNIRATARTTRRVKMVKALLNGFVLPYGQGDRAQEQITAIGMARIEGATKFAAMEPRGFDTGPQEQLQGLVGKALWGEGSWAIGEP